MNKTTRSFLQEYSGFVHSCYAKNYQDNYDPQRFGPLSSPPRSLGAVCRSLAKRTLLVFGLGKVSSVADHWEKSFTFVAPWLTRLERLFSQLADVESRSLLVELVAYRALGHRKVKLAFNAPELLEGASRMEAIASTTESVEVPSVTALTPWRLKRIDLSPVGLPLSLYTIPAGAYIMFLAQQYRCPRRTHPIEAGPGDYVLDGGGGWGDTALYFAIRVGETGKVFSFEFLPEHLAIMRKNLDLNPSLKGRVATVENALWSRSGQLMKYHEQGPGTHILADQAGPEQTRVESVTIDDWFSRNNIHRLDFIKLDIEGSELAALQGAERVLRRFTPRLAVCIYHKFEDFFDIPDYLSSLDVGYRFYIRHFSIHSEETLLFAEKEPSGAGPG